MNFTGKYRNCPSCGNKVNIVTGGDNCQNSIILPNGIRTTCGYNLVDFKKNENSTAFCKNAAINVGLVFPAMLVAIIIGIILFVAVLAPAIVNGFLNSPGTQGCGASFGVIIIAGSMIGVFGLATGIAKKGAKIIILFFKKIFGDW